MILSQESCGDVVATATYSHGKMSVLVLVPIESPSNRSASPLVHHFIRVPSVGEKIALPSSGRIFYFVVTDVVHSSLQQLKGFVLQVSIFVR